MPEKFDPEEAKKFLLSKEESEKQHREKERKTVLEKISNFLRKEFSGSDVEVYLIGSILQPFSFYSHSDIDIVLKNFKGERFDLWAKAEKEVGRKVEIIPFETSHFKDFILKNGLKIL